jgi:enterochelin esterase family protein
MARRASAAWLVVAAAALVLEASAADPARVHADGPAPAQPAVSGLVAEFGRHPIVAIAEYHQLVQAGEFYTTLVRDPSFQRAVNDIVIEFASGQSQSLLDRYIVQGDSLPPDSLRSIWRNSSKAASWDSPVYARWLAAIRDVNRTLSPGRRLRVLAGDTPVDWANLRSPADWTALGPNDVSFARVIRDEVLARHHRALVVLGSNHLARGGSFRDRSENTTTRVEAAAPGAMYIALMFSGWPGGDTTEQRIAHERWPVPALCSCQDRWPGALELANASGVSRLGSRVDGLLYLGPTAALDTQRPAHADVESYDVDELDRRSYLEWGDSTRARRFLGLGKVVEYQLASATLGQSRRIWVYTPPGYQPSSGSDCDLLVAFDGGLYLSDIPLPTMLDTLLTAKRIAPTVAVFVDNASSTARLADLANHERFVKFIGDELVPWAREHFRVSHDPHRATLTGSSAGGLASAFIALRRPDLFGNVVSQSGAFWRGAEGSDGAPFEWLTAQFAAAPKQDIRFVMEVGSTESHGAMSGTAPSILDANRHLRDVLQQRGYPVLYAEVEGGVHAAQTWAPRLPGALAASAAARRGS